MFFGILFVPIIMIFYFVLLGVWNWINEWVLVCLMCLHTFVLCVYLFSTSVK